MLRTVLFLVLSLALTGMIFFRYDQRFGNDGIPSLGKRATYLPYYAAFLLPAEVLLIPLLLSPFVGFSQAVDITLSTCVGIFLHISLYILVLLALRPLLRGRISARTCALLWVIPNILYLTTSRAYQPSRPVWVVMIPGQWSHLWFVLWFAGAVGVLGWYMIQHLRFRHGILASATPVTDPQTQYIWEEALREAGLRNPKYQLVISPAVQTPLSIGLLPRSTRVVLPPRPYTPEELHWIIRHEVIHLARMDNWNKFFLLFCTAICWFNPLMWVAMKTCAQDLELSCDETVLLFAHQPDRKEYAVLLLNTAGDARGFTTCLSASASTLRHRLQQILTPSVRSSGALVAGLLFFLMTMSFGCVGLAQGTISGAQVFSPAGDAAPYQVSGIHVQHPDYQEEGMDYTLSDPQAFQAYLSGLTLSRLMGTYTFPDQEREFYCFLSHDQDEYLLAITDDLMEVTLLGRGDDSTYYYLPQGFDWNYLMGLLEATPSPYA